MVWATGLWEGRAAARFVVLAGAGMSLGARSALRSDSHHLLVNQQRGLYRRALVLFVGGLLYTPVWPADILHFYGVYIAIGAALLGARNRVLGFAAGGAVAAFPLLTAVFDYERGWNWSDLSYDGFWTARGMVRHLFFNGFHPVIPWVAFLLVGMILGRQDTRSRRVRTAWLTGGICMAVLAELASRWILHSAASSVTPQEMEELSAVFGTGPMPPMPLYMIAACGTAIVVIMVCIELGLRYPTAPWMLPLIYTGQLALTLYIAHVIVGMGMLDALGRLEDQSMEFALGSALVFCALAVVFSTCWRRQFDRGPLEWLLRRWTS